MHERDMTPLDHLLTGLDRGLRAVFSSPQAARKSPGLRFELPHLEKAEQQEAGGLMRVNHSGEVAAQGLYHGQALVERDPQLRAQLLQAARDEGDHLAWCRERLDELGARTSALNPLWYAGSVAIGALAGVVGSKWSLGFVVETERQVEAHLDDHLGRLPGGDERSRAILAQMRADEIDHGAAARAAGGVDLPAPVRALMRLTSRVMTRVAYWL
jgi:ubiquinone biosynthesis monooxygenase Coq7